MLSDMTEQEKRDFAERLSGLPGNVLRSQEKSIRTNRISTAIYVPALIVFGLVMKINMAIYLPIVLASSAVIHFTGWLGSRLALNKIIKNISNKKLTYKEYKKLKKTGELDRLLGIEEPTAEATEPEIKKPEPEGVTLSAEEVAALRRLISEKGGAGSEILDRHQPQGQPTTEGSTTVEQTETPAIPSNKPSTTDDGRDA